MGRGRRAFAEYTTDHTVLNKYLQSLPRPCGKLATSLELTQVVERNHSVSTAKVLACKTLFTGKQYYEIRRREEAGEKKIRRAWRDSNPRPSASKAAALSI
jgi:hypothetical protein